MIAILVGLSLAGNSQFQGCLQVEGETCILCYESYPLGLRKGCGPPPPIPDNCDIYGYDLKNRKIYCAACDSQYSLSTSGTSGRLPCAAKNEIRGCLRSTHPPGLRQNCDYCANNQYVQIPGPSKCVSAGAQAIEHCLWGGQFDPKAGGAACARCKPPYAVGVDRRHCEPAFAPGCLINGEKKGPLKCIACDVYNGYYMLPNLQCAKK